MDRLVGFWDPSGSWPGTAPGSAAFAAALRSWSRDAGVGTRTSGGWDLSFFLETGSPERLLSLSLDGIAMALDTGRGGTILSLAPDGTVAVEFLAHTWPIEELRVTGMVRLAGATRRPLAYGVRVVPRALVEGRFERSLSASRTWIPGPAATTETAITVRAGMRQRDALLRLGARLRWREPRAPVAALASLLPAWMIPAPDRLEHLLAAGLDLGTRMRPWEVASASATARSRSPLRSPSPPVTMAG